VGGTETGELTAIMGPSGKSSRSFREVYHKGNVFALTFSCDRLGAGKTTLLECISLRNRFWEGGIEFDGKPTTGDYFTTSGE